MLLGQDLSLGAVPAVTSCLVCTWYIQREHGLLFPEIPQASLQDVGVSSPTSVYSV